MRDWDRALGELTTEPDEEGWVTLREAAGATGLSRSTLRSWYRSGQIPSRVVPGLHGPQRLVRLDAVVDRALQSSRAYHQLEQARSVATELEALRARVASIERYLGLD